MTPVAEEESRIAEEESVELIDYLSVVWKYRLMIVAGTAALMAAAAVISLVAPRAYRASLLLEVGRVFVPGKGDGIDAVVLIENPQTTAQVMTSDGTLSDLRAFLKLDTPLSALRRALAVKVIKNDPDALLELTLTSDDPRRVLDGLTFLAERVIAEHRGRYEAGLALLDRKSQGLEEKIATSDLQRDSLHKEIAEVQEQIAAEGRYRTQLSADIDRLEADLARRRSEFATVKPNSTEAVIGQGVIQSLDMRVNDLKTERNKTYGRIAEWRASIYDLQDRMTTIQAQMTDSRSALVQLANTRARSENTNVRSAPVLPTKPVSPRTALNLTVAGVLGVMFFIMAAFLRSYLEDARRRRLFSSHNMLR